MKAISEGIYQRGKHCTKYVRRRIPADIRAAYPANQEHIVRSLGTADLHDAKELARAELARIDTEFRQKRQQLDLSQVSLNPTTVHRAIHWLNCKLSLEYQVENGTSPIKKI